MRRLEEERIDETEDGGIDPDPECEHDHRRRRKSPRLAELPKRKPEVVEHMVRCRERAVWIQPRENRL